MKKMQKHEGFTLIELLIVVAIIGIIAAIAVPGLLRARMAGNEASAIGSVRAIHSANVTYFSVCGGYSNQAFDTAAVGLATLRYLPPEFNVAAPVNKSGYTMALGAGLPTAASGSNTGQCVGAQTTFYATAVPMVVGNTGQRGFGVRESGTVYQDSSGVAPADAAPAGPVVAGNITILQ